VGRKSGLLKQHLNTHKPELTLYKSQNTQHRTPCTHCQSHPPTHTHTHNTHLLHDTPSASSSSAPSYSSLSCWQSYASGCSPWYAAPL
jgi:hypothetical protein